MPLTQVKMRIFTRLLCVLAHAATLNANVEKTVFLGPSPVTPSNVDDNSTPLSLDNLHIDVLDPAHRHILPTRLPVQFPVEAAPHGLDSWYLLHGLEHNRRYEVRICWPATQPTDFWLDTFTIGALYASPDLVHSLVDYNIVHSKELDLRAHSRADSLLFLRIQAAASYFTTNQTLMQQSEPVDVDIILDPFILNILPRSLGPTAVYIILVGVFAWVASGFIYRWLLPIAHQVPDKEE
ncbi:unnamed protein product [Periconia digitata]|uniref:Phosphatidylinositol-glycan biosynthesis class X protein n=1 Tax=Periconia digitata TaxID=1303443 RepID=A0A9W4U7H4_9PLEO|nr:unnamed protein product [Periconia digitata]